MLLIDIYKYSILTVPTTGNQLTQGEDVLSASSVDQEPGVANTCYPRAFATEFGTYYALQALVERAGCWIQTAR